MRGVKYDEMLRSKYCIKFYEPLGRGNELFLSAKEGRCKCGRLG